MCVRNPKTFRNCTRITHITGKVGKWLRKEWRFEIADEKRWNEEKFEKVGKDGRGGKKETGRIRRNEEDAGERIIKKGPSRVPTILESCIRPS